MIFQRRHNHGWDHAASHARESATAAKESARRSAMAAKEAAERSASSARNSAMESGEMARNAVRSHPLLAAGSLATLVLGVVLGCVVSKFGPTFARYLKMRRM